MTESDVEMNWNNVGSFIVKFGIPGVLALYLVYWSTGRADLKITNIENAVTVHMAETRELTNSVDTLQRQQDRTNLILQQICVNGAAIRDRANCFR